MTLATLKQLVNDRRRTTNTTFVSEEEIVRYLNEAMRRIQGENDWDFTQTSASIAYTDGTTQYALSAIGNNDIKEPIQLFYSNDFNLTFVSPEDFPYLSAYAFNIYAIDGNYIDISTNFGSQTLVFDYYSTYMAKTSGGSWQTELISATDESLIPERYQDILVDWSIYRIGQKSKNNNDVQLALQDYTSKLEQLRRKYFSKAAYTRYRIKNPREYTALNLDAREDPLRQKSC